jgi:hypothetical protein
MAKTLAAVPALPHIERTFTSTRSSRPVSLRAEDQYWWSPINNLSTTLAIAVQESRARSPAVAAVDELLRQHISSWIGGSNLVCAFPA